MPAPVFVAFQQGIETLIGEGFDSERTTLVTRTIVVFQLGCTVLQPRAQNPGWWNGAPESGCGSSASAAFSVSRASPTMTTVGGYLLKSWWGRCQMLALPTSPMSVSTSFQ